MSQLPLFDTSAQSPRNRCCEKCGHVLPDFDPVTAEQTLEIYEHYPLKKARRQARNSIRHAMLRIQAEDPNVNAYEFLLAATKAYKKAVTHWAEDDQKFVPHASSWYNAECYLDDRRTWERGTARGQEDREAKSQHVNLIRTEELAEGMRILRAYIEDNNMDAARNWAQGFFRPEERNLPEVRQLTEKIND